MPTNSDTTSLNYWLKWDVLICAIWVSTPMVIAIWMIWKYERSAHSESEKQKNHQYQAEVLYEENAWRPCLREIHPLWLLSFRILCFLVLLVTLVSDVAFHGWGILNYYTQWTFVLVTIYFGLGSMLSIYGLGQHYKIHSQTNVKNGGIGKEQGLYVPLAYSENTCKALMDKNSIHQDKSGYFFSVDTLRHVFQIIFQMTAGAVMLTDSVYWLVIFPFLTVKEYEMNCLTVLTHTINAVALLGDTVLNSLPFPWFRISYFLLWTGIYVFVQWVVHACILLPWPYPFLDLSAENATVWYLLVALLHIPCYGICSLIVNLKNYILSRWSTLSYQGLR